MKRAATVALFFAACSDDLPPCSETCVAQHWVGSAAEGALGHGLASPLDINGDGIADLTAGAPFSSSGSSEQAGSVYAWSGANGGLLLEWQGSDDLALFGHAVVTLPDVDGDGLADVVAAAPNHIGGGLVLARSPISGRILWRLNGEGRLGSSLALAGHHDGDTIEDVVAGEPGSETGRAVLVSGSDGTLLRTYEGSPSFGHCVAAIADQDGDGLRDLLIGAPFEESAGVAPGAAFVVSSATGATLLAVVGEDTGARFGEALASVPDIDGDGLDDLAVGAPYTNAPGQIGQVYVFSSPTGALLHRLVGTQPGAIYGRLVARVLDVDGDGTDDLAIGAPWRRVDGMDRAGYFEIRSGRTMELITSVSGTRENAWLGWHVVPAERMIDGTRHGILVSSIMSEENGVPGAGRIELYELSLR